MVESFTSNCTREHFVLFVISILQFSFSYDNEKENWRILTNKSGFSGHGVACWPLVRGFKPSRSRRIFKGEKILSTPSFGGEVKPSVPCRRFTACKRTLECTLEVGRSRQNYRLSFLPTNSSTFRCL